MKKRLLISCLVLLTSINLKAQQRTTEPPKKASKIIVMLKDTSNTALNRIAKGLFEKGFTIEMKDETAKILSTKEFAPNHPSIFLKIRASVNDSSVVFTGTYAWTLTSGLFPSAQEYMPIEYRGMKKSAAMQAWKSLDEIAHMFGNIITYSL